MSSTDASWNKYRYKCSNGTTHTLIQSELDALPTMCPDGYAIVGDIIIIEERRSNLVEVKEEQVKTGGHFRIDCRHVCPVGPTGTIFEYDFTEKIGYNVLNIQLIPKIVFVGDMFDVGVAPNTIVGALTQDTSPTGTMLHVSSTVFDYTDVGIHVDLFNGVSELHDCLQVLEVDKANGTLTVENPPTSVISAGTYVRITTFMAKDFDMPPPDRYPLGTTKIGGSYVPANQPVRLYYKKATADDCSIYVIREYLY